MGLSDGANAYPTYIVKSCSYRLELQAVAA